MKQAEIVMDTTKLKDLVEQYPAGSRTSQAIKGAYLVSELAPELIELRKVDRHVLPHGGFTERTREVDYAILALIQESASNLFQPGRKTMDMGSYGSLDARREMLAIDPELACWGEELLKIAHEKYDVSHLDILTSKLSRTLDMDRSVTERVFELEQSFMPIYAAFQDAIISAFHMRQRRLEGYNVNVKEGVSEPIDARVIIAQLGDTELNNRYECKDMALDVFACMINERSTEYLGIHNNGKHRMLVAYSQTNRVATRLSHNVFNDSVSDICLTTERREIESSYFKAYRKAGKCSK
jgi:hypothetical protein